MTMPEPPLIDRLREMILEGELKPGERVPEAGLAERLGVSRTPVRNVLPVLAAEGLLTPVGKRGYAVAAFDDRASVDALEMRATLEGLAARMVARTGAPPELLAQLRQCLAEGDAILGGRSIALSQHSRYGAMNARFHDLIVEAAGDPLLATFIERLKRVPFVDPATIAFDNYTPEQAFDLLFRAHGDHHAIVDAIADRDASRAESLFREHATGQRASMFDKRRRGE